MYIKNILFDIFKEKDLDLRTITKQYQALKFSENEFTELTTMIKKTMVKNKLIKKMNDFKKVIVKIGSLRESIVLDEKNEHMAVEKELTLFDRIGKIEGVTKIMEVTYDFIEKDHALFSIYSSNSKKKA